MGRNCSTLVIVASIPSSSGQPDRSVDLLAEATLGRPSPRKRGTTEMDDYQVDAGFLLLLQLYVSLLSYDRPFVHSDWLDLRHEVYYISSTLIYSRSRQKQFYFGPPS
ncbi:hypothetical protein H9L39_00805 [Fusarium oxysporum f. sp. albedinis]|nr:hypothetical protein H9L39_00805 [Fusarium oxysporum f. sp. albedinis]